MNGTNSSLQDAINHLNTNGVIIFTKNYHIDESEQFDIFNKNVTLDLNGHSLSLSNELKSSVSNNGILTIKGGTIEVNNVGASLYISDINSKLIIEDVTIVSGSNAKLSISLNGGILDIDASSNEGALEINPSSGRVDIRGGVNYTFTNADSDCTVNIYDGYFGNEIDNLDNESIRCDVRIYGGNFKFEPNQSLIADGYIVKDSSDNEYPYIVIKN